MYKYSSSEINEFIESKTLNDKEFYTFDDVCDLVKEKLTDSKSLIVISSSFNSFCVKYR